MPVRGSFVVLLCLMLAGCLTPNTLTDRAFNSGAVRDFNGDLNQVTTAVAAAMERLPVNVSDPMPRGPDRVIDFNRPTDAHNWGEIGRVVIEPLGPNQTRVIVAVENRYKLQPTHGTEQAFADIIFNGAERRLVQVPAGLGGSR
ncbi:MAG: hypothetical protein WAU68_08740 [Vitreimonas sp.]